MPFKDPEARKANHKAWREANRDKRKAVDKAWREANPEKVKAIYKTYYEANAEKLRAANKAWKEANSEKVKTHYEAYKTDPLNGARQTIYKLTGLKKAEIPTELLEAQALIIQINREIRNHEKLHRA